jgi:hypothetical protein
MLGGELVMILVSKNSRFEQFGRTIQIFHVLAFPVHHRPTPEHDGKQEKEK